MLLMAKLIVIFIATIKAKKSTLRLGYSSSMVSVFGQNCFENRSTFYECYDWPIMYSYLAKLHPIVDAEFKFYGVEQNFTFLQDRNTILGALYAGEIAVNS